MLKGLGRDEAESILREQGQVEVSCDFCGQQEQGDKPIERMIPFVAAFVDQVDLAGRRITVDWQPDY